MAPPRLRVDHVSIAVRSMDRALTFFLEHFPARPGHPPDDGYGDPPEFRWTDFMIGNFKIELIESARGGSFVERFLAERGEGLHHLSLKVDRLAPHLARLEADGIRIVDRFVEPDGHETAFIHPHSAFGTLVQFWEESDPVPLAAPSGGGTVTQHGVRWKMDHLSLAVEHIAPAVRFLERHFAAVVEVGPHLGYDRSFRLMTLLLGDYRLELMEPTSAEGFLARFLARRGPGMHHLSIDVEDLDAALAPFERAGVRVVDRFEFAPDRKTAFLHPRSLFGVLVQLWQVPVDEWSRLPAPLAGTTG